MTKKNGYLHEDYQGGPTMTLLNVLSLLGVLTVLKAPNVLNVLNVLDIPKDASLTCWALFLAISLTYFKFRTESMNRLPAQWPF